MPTVELTLCISTLMPWPFHPEPVITRAKLKHQKEGAKNYTPCRQRLIQEMWKKKTLCLINHGHFKSMCFGGSLH